MIKRKYLLLLLLLLPLYVYADNGVNFDYTIETRVNLEGKELEAGEFTFELRDHKGNLIETATNDKDGRVVFSPMSHTFMFNNGYNYNITYDKTQWYYRRDESFTVPRTYESYIYTIEMVNNKNNHYQIDDGIAYVGVHGGLSDNGDTISVNYLKDYENLNPNEYEKTGKSIYHASPNELEGEMYAVYDPNTKTITLFRDEPNKYGDEEVIDGKTYINHMEPYQREGSDSWEVNYIPDRIKGEAKKIVIQDPMKIAGDRTIYLFNYYNELEEIIGLDKIDTSEQEDFYMVFYDDPSIKELDLSTWDTSSGTRMNEMFWGCISLEKLYIDNFDTSKVTSFSNMFSYTVNLKKIDMSIFDFTSVNSYGLEYMFYKVGVEALDFTKAKFRDDMSDYNPEYIIYYAKDLKYLNFPLKSKIGYSTFYDTSCLNVAKLNMRDQYPTNGTYIDDNGVEREKKYFRGGLDNSYYEYVFYLPNNKTLINMKAFIDYMEYGYNTIYGESYTTIDKDYSELDTTLILRPMCNQTPSTFNVTYAKQEAKGVKGIIEEIKENPKTGVFKYSLLTLLLSVSLFLYYIFVLKNKSLFKNK